MITARQETARTLAAAIGMTEEQADTLLEATVLVTWDPACAKLADLIRTLLSRTLANVVMLPIADKLANRAEEEGTNRSLMIEALVMVREGRNPATIRDELASYLPLHTRRKLFEDEEQEAA